MIHIDKQVVNGPLNQEAQIFGSNTLNEGMCQRCRDHVEPISHIVEETIEIVEDGCFAIFKDFFKRIFDKISEIVC